MPTPREHLANLVRLVQDEVDFPAVTHAELDDLVQSRYVVVTSTDYDGQPDSYAVESVDTLEQCQELVEEHLFREILGGYAYHARVYDLDLGQKIQYEVVREIRWLSP